MAFALCFTGLSGSGKSTLANKLVMYFTDHHIPIQLIDGDVLRKELGNLFGYSYEERMKQNRVVRVLTKYLLKNGINTIIAIVAPYDTMRKEMREFIGDSYIQCYLNCDSTVCAQRDVKGYYALADQGMIDNFNGRDEIYDIPLDSEIEIDTAKLSVEDSVQKILKYLEGRYDGL